MSLGLDEHEIHDFSIEPHFGSRETDRGIKELTATSLNLTSNARDSVAN
jgi:hypothetical protein